MQRVHRTSERSLHADEHTAISIGQPNEAQRHIGILYRDSESGEILMLHLAMHHDLQNGTPDPSFLWVSPDIDPKRARQVGVICRSIWNSNGKYIPYAFSQPNDSFDENTWRFLIGPTRHGLTCATFVLAVFHHARLPLLDYSSWPTNRPGDAEWQQKIISWLKGRASEEHIRLLESEVGCVRYRPEEVAAAGTINPLPATFQIAAERGQQIVARLNGAGAV